MNKVLSCNVVMKQRQDKYKNLKSINPVIPAATIIVVTDLPWYKSWFGLKPTRIKVGDGITTFNKLNFI